MGDGDRHLSGCDVLAVDRKDAGGGFPNAQVGSCRCLRSADSMGSSSKCTSQITLRRTSTLSMRKLKPKSRSTAWLSFLASCRHVQWDLSQNGRASISRSFKHCGTRL